MTLLLAQPVGCAHRQSGPAVGEREHGRETGIRVKKGGIHFSVEAPEAVSVVLVIMRTRTSEPFTYETRPIRGQTGVWTVAVDLDPGEYRYFFIVDGTVTVAERPGRIEQDDFGGVTGVFTVHQTPEGLLKTF